VSKFKAPEALLQELGVQAPADIKVEPIAQYCGATIVYEPLTGCEAYIAGHGRRAIITVNSDASLPRRRFSAAHELGHWMRDRGQVAIACTERQFLAGWDDDDPERRANRYAADLLLPKFLFRPAARKKACTLATAGDLADMFRTSLTATAIRLVEEGDCPSMLVWFEASGRRWFARSPILPDAVWPHARPGRGSLAHALISGGRGPRSGIVDANEWINHPRARDFEVHEDSVKIGDSILTLLWWKDERMVIELDDHDHDSDRDAF